MTAGGFVLVVGPSGAGKDTLIALAKHALAHDERFVFPRRIVTRPISAWEDHDTIDQEGFERAVALGRFCLSWRAHGLCYALAGDLLQATALGRIVICNVSRSVIDEARRRLPNVAVVEITAPEDVLACRLAARGREDSADVQARVARSRVFGGSRPDLTIVNDRAPDEGGAQLLLFLLQQAGHAQMVNAAGVLATSS